jgi:hypothetical protein
LPFVLFLLGGPFTGLSGKKFGGIPMFNHFVSSPRREEGRLFLGFNNVLASFTITSCLAVAASATRFRYTASNSYLGQGFTGRSNGGEVRAEVIGFVG